MFCKNCGNELSERAKFCSKCGNSVENAEEEKIETVQEEALDGRDNTPPVTIAETEAQKSEQTAVAVMDKPEEQTAEEPAEQQAVTQPEYNDFSAQEEEKPVKKSKKGVIIGASAAVIAAGAAAVGYFCFSNEIMRLFMGDAGFAAMVEGNSIEYISGGSVDSKEMDAALADYVEEMFYGSEAEETEVTKSMLDQVLSLYGDSSVKITTEIEPGMLLAMADSEGMLDLFNTETVLEMVMGEDCDRVSLMLNEDGGRVLGADLYVQDEKTVILLPELTSQSFYADPDSGEEGEKTERTEFSETEMKRIREEILEIYNKNLKNTEIEYTKGGTDLVISDCAIDSERVIISFSAENLNAMLKEMGDFLRNDEYLRTYYVEATGGDIADYEKKFDEAEYDITAQLTVETYITDHAKVTGKKIMLTETDEETGKTFDMSFETTLGNCDFYIGDSDLSIAFTQRKTDETSGEMEITADGEELGAPLVLAVSYSGIGSAEYCGQTVSTGTYTLKLSEKDEFFDYILKGASAAEEDEEQMSARLSSDFGSDMDLSAIVGMLKNVKIETSVECDGASVKSAFSMEIPLFFDVAFTAEVTPLEAEAPVMPDYSQAIDINGDFEGGEYDGLKAEIYENLLALGEKSELIGMITESSDITGELEKLTAEHGFVKNYSAYSDETRINADNVAEEIHSAFFCAMNDGLLNLEYGEEYAEYLQKVYSLEGTTAKIYFDEKGEVTVLDDGGHFYVDFNLMAQEYFTSASRPKNLYAEIVMSALLDDAAVTVIYTDDSGNLPASLPNSYNYYDGVFYFSGEEENTLYDFIIGTYPDLSYGESESEYEFLNLTIERDTMDINAKKAAACAQEYFSGKNDIFVNSYGFTGSVIMENNDGVWSFGGCYAGDTEVKTEEFFTQDITAEFTDYLNSNLEAGHSDLQLHFYADDDGVVYICGAAAVLEKYDFDFQQIGVPETYDFTDGYYCFWSLASYGSCPEIKGIYWNEHVEAIPVGSWCSVTDAPLGHYEGLFNY